MGSEVVIDDELMTDDVVRPGVVGPGPEVVTDDVEVVTDEVVGPEVNCKNFSDCAQAGC